MLGRRPDPSIITTGALHSEPNQIDGQRGIPVLHTATGQKVAEVERDEWLLSDAATQRLEQLRKAANALALGRFVQQELLGNTVAGGGQPATPPKPGNNLVLAGPQGGAQMAMGGGNRIFSRADVRELITASHQAKDERRLTALGQRVIQMLARQDRAERTYAKR